MAEAMELNLSLNKPGNQPLENPITTPLDQGESEKVSKVPKQYTNKAYYQDDTLGSDVLKQKYLAPWEQHPYELWTRQANALASVEKTKTKRNEWEKKFFSILEDFKFVRVFVSKVINSLYGFLRNTFDGQQPKSYIFSFSGKIHVGFDNMWLK